MNIEPSSIQEALDLIYYVLNQGDSRYNDSFSEETLADFLVSKAISVEKESIPQLNPSKEEFAKIWGVQQREKYILKTLLEQRGFSKNQILFESSFLEYHPDVLAESGDELILGECCSCKVCKIKDFLQADAKEVWVLVPDEIDRLFIFKKGPNWEKKLNEFNKLRLQELKKIQSPIDRLVWKKNEPKIVSKQIKTTNSC